MCKIALPGWHHNGFSKNKEGEYTRTDGWESGWVRSFKREHEEGDKGKDVIWDTEI